MKFVSSLISSSLIAALGLGAHAAVVTVDDFTTDQFVLINDAVSNGAAGAGSIGGAREVTITNDSANPSLSDSIFNVQNGAASFDSGSGSDGTGVKSTFRLDYDGLTDGAFDNMGLGGIDVVDGTNDVFEIAANFAEGTSSIQIQVWDGSGNALSNIIEVNTSGVFVIPFNQFGDIDFTNITALSVFVESSTPAADLSLAYIRANNSAVAIPVPGAAILFGTALAGAAVARRSRRRA